MIDKKVKYVTLSIMSLVLIACDQNPFHSDRESTPYNNKAPETFLFLFVSPDSSVDSDTSGIEGIDTTASKQTLHWWGEDSDGEVIGYYYQWDYQEERLWTSNEHEVFYVPIRSNYDEFTFRVWAVDNDSLIDPTPAVQIFPVFNSFPEINFKNNSNPLVLAGDPNVINYTFPTRTFFWDISDVDGIETVTSIKWALDDTTEWNTIEKNDGVLPDHITITGIDEGYHIFYAKSVDIAGSESNTIFFPDSTDDQVPNKWYVQAPAGEVLLVDDYALGQTDGTAQNFYADILSEIVSGFSIWEIGNTGIP